MNILYFFGAALLALSLSLQRCSFAASTATPVAMPSPPSPSTLRTVVFLQGLGTSLPVTGPPDPRCGEGAFACIKQALKSSYGYGDADFLDFSYEGGAVTDGEWHPNSYGCETVVGQSLEQSSGVLETMLRRYSEAHGDKRVEYVLIGHSYGGLVAFRSLEKAMAPDAPYRVKAVITLDSPLYGATLAGLGDAIQEEIKRASNNNALVTAIAPVIIGSLTRCMKGPAIDQIAGFAVDKQATDEANKALAEKAVAAPYNVSISTLGNADDLLYLIDGRETQAIKGIPGSIPLYRLGNAVTDALAGRFGTNDPLGHGRIYSLAQTVSTIAATVGPNT